MTTLQKAIKYIATAFAIFLIISIVSGILGVAGIFGLFEENALLDTLKTYSVSNGITKLEIDIAAADFTIKESDSFFVESNLKNLNVTEKNGVLIIKAKNRIGIKHTNATLVLGIPKETVFKDADITTGAGKLSIDILAADALELEFGAGEVIINSLVSNNNININGGAGKITILDGQLNNLDLDMGVGQLNLTAALSGNNDFDLGVGESNLTLIGNEEDYSIQIEKGVGNVTVNGKSVSNYNTVNGNSIIDIDGGVGAINLKFK